VSMEPDVLFQCPICSEAVTTLTDSTYVQVDALMISEAVAEAEIQNPTLPRYPFASKLFGESRVPDAEIYREVREAVLAVQASHLELNQLQRQLARRLTGEQYQLVFIELLKDTNLHSVLQRIDSKFIKSRTVQTRVQEMVVFAIEDTNTEAQFTRAALGTAGDIVLTAGTAGVGNLSKLTADQVVKAAADGSCNGLIFTMFAAVEVYRWAKRDIDGSTCIKNIGEHAFGMYMGVYGSMEGAAYGATAGAQIGTVVPVVGTAVGGVVGAVVGMFFGGLIADGLGRWVYRKYIPNKGTRVQERIEEVEQRLSPREVADVAARIFNVDLDRDSYADAHQQYRRMLLRNHPDKAPPGTSLDELDRRKQETREILANWNVVRAYYYDNNLVNDDSVQECVLTACTLKVFEDGIWKTVRSWWGDENLHHVQNPATEKIEKDYVYL
jgi:hypothetical protein